MLECHCSALSGLWVKDTFMTLSQTAKKRGVRTCEYIRDKDNGKFKLPSLAQLIREKSSGCETMP